jgi:D-alanyl-D-alanine carboxypeptidase
MKGKLIATAVAASLALAGPTLAESPQDRLQGLLDSFQQDYGFPGATAAMALPDGSVVTGGGGCCRRRGRHADDIRQPDAGR